MTSDFAGVWVTTGLICPTFCRNVFSGLDGADVDPVADSPLEVLDPPLRAFWAILMHPADPTESTNEKDEDKCDEPIMGFHVFLVRI